MACSLIWANQGTMVEFVTCLLLKQGLGTHCVAEAGLDS